MANAHKVGELVLVVSKSGRYCERAGISGVHKRTGNYIVHGQQYRRDGRSTADIRDRIEFAPFEELEVKIQKAHTARCLRQDIREVVEHLSKADSLDGLSTEELYLFHKQLKEINAKLSAKGNQG